MGEFSGFGGSGESGGCGVFDRPCKSGDSDDTGEFGNSVVGDCVRSGECGVFGVSGGSGELGNTGDAGCNGYTGEYGESGGSSKSGDFADRLS